MEYLLSIPLKKTYEVDLVKYLKVSITAQYGNVDEKSKDNLEVLNRMRNNATSRNIESSQETSLEIIEKYYDQLVLLHNKLPQANIPFKWKDAFEKGGIFSSSSMTVSNLSFEKVCIMFNIGALMSTLGAYYCKEGAFNDNSLKQAIKHFQGAAGIFQALKHTTSSSSDGNELTFDLQTEVLNMLQHMMLAQAQEAFFFKAYNDGMKESSIARIAAQCVEFYGEVEKQIQSINFKDKSFLPEWVDIFIQKHNAYKGVAEYYQAMVAKDKKEFGEQITRLTKALEFLKSAETRVVIGMAEKFKEIVNKATLALEEVKRDNDFIYHARIPDYKSLPTISKALLAKCTDIPNLFFPNETDLFTNLLPLAMHQSISRFENRKQELVNGEIAHLREMTQTLSGILASLNLPAAIEDTQGVEVPKSIQEKATAIRQKGGIEEIERLINELPDLLKRNREILDEIERSLNAEEESDSKLRSQFKDKWTRTQSNKLNQTWRSHIAKYRSIIEKAVEADKKLKGNYDMNIEKIRLLSSPSNALASAIPSNQSGGSSIDDSAVQALRQLMLQVDSLKRERESLENDLKNIEFEELRKQFMSYLNVNAGVDETTVAAEVIGNAYNELQKKVRQSKEKQERLITEIQEANQKFVAQRGSSGSKRDQFLKDCAAAYEAYMQLLSNLKEGNKFYNDLTQLLVNLQGKVNDFCFARKAEREELCKDLQNDIVSKPNDPIPKRKPSNNVPRQNLITAANKVSDATSNLLYNIDDENMDREASDTLLSLSKPVANATAKLVLKAKDVASRCDDQASKNRVISAATQCALATSQLVSCAKVVAPTIHSPNCQKQIVDASKEVSKAVDNINRVCKDSIQDYHLNGQVDQAAGEVNDALNNLLNYVRSLGSTGHRGRKQPGDDGAVDTILDATDRLFSSTGDASEMVKQAKILAQATSQLIQNIKGQAETQPDSDIQKRLLSAAKSLADATSRLVEAAKGCATNPNDSNSQAALRAAAEDLRNATNTAASNALKQKLMNRLEATAKHATAMATQNIAAVHGCAPYNQNGPNQNEMNQLCREVNGSIPPVVSSIKAYHNEPNNSTKQSQLINSCENFMGPSLRLANVSLSSSPTISDKSASIQLTQSAQQLAEALSELRSCLTKASEACSFSNEINAAIDNIRQLNIELSECRMAALKHSLKPLPGDNFDHCSSRLNSACKSVASAMAQLLSATSQGEQNYIGTASREVTSSLKNLTSSARGVAATANERDVQMQVLDHSNQILELSVTLFEEIRWALENSQDSERHQRLTNIAKSLSSALQNCVTCLPSHKDLDDSIRQISDSTRSLTLDHHYSSHKSYAELQNDIQMAATRLNESTSEVIESSRLPSKLAPVSKNFAHHYSTLFELTNEISGQTSDNLVKQQIRSCLDDLSASSSRFLQSAKTVSADPNAPNSSSQMAAAARSVTQSISNLLDICSSSAPGQKECDQAIQNIQMMRSYLDNPSIQLNDSTYFECLELVTEKSRRLGDAMTGIANNARRNEHESFGESVRDASDSVCGLLEGAAQAAYLVGASDPTSIAGRAGIIDINLLNRCQETIHNACAQLTAPAATKDQIIRCATDIAKSTSNLCNACRVASSRTQNPYHRKNFVQSAKDVANATATLIKEIKPLEESSAAHMNENCRIATRPLLESVDNLISFANSPEFASVPAQISGKARQHQQPITQYGKAIIDASSNMIMSAKTLAINPKDPPGWQILANHSKNVSDSIKKLVTSIKDASPGQNECDDALEKLGSCIKKLDQSSLDAINKILHVRNDNTAKGFREAVSASLSEIRENIDPVRVAGKSKAEKLGHSITQLIGYFDLLVSNSIGYASKIPDDKQQNQILDKSKAVCESALQLIYTVKECGGNPKATSLHSEIEDSSQDMKNAIKNFENLMQSAASEEGHVNSIIEQLTKSLTRITASSAIYSNGSGSSPDNLSYVDYQTRMVANVKDIARIAQDMSAKSSTQVSQLGSLCTRLSENYANLANDVNGIAAATNNIETASRIKSSVQELGTACVDIVKNAGSCLTNPGDSYSQRELTDSARNVSEKCSYVLAAFQAGSRGTQACIMAANSVQGIIGDIDTTILFANSGALNPEDPNDSFGIYKDEILKTAKALVEDTKTLVAGAASSQEALAVAAQNAVQTITQLTTAVKQGAATLGSNNSEAQVMLLNSVKDVAIALNELIDATKTASGKNINDPAMMHLKDSAKVMVTNVTSLLKTVKTVEDEQQRGTRALEATIDGIEGEIRSYDSGSMYINQDVTPEHLIRATKPVTMATAKAVAAGTSGQQDDIIVVANMGRKAIHDLLQVCKSAALLADNQEIKIRILDAGKKCSYDYQQLLKIIFHILQRPTNVNDVKQQLYQMSRTIAASVTEIVSLAEMLKNVDWVDPEDPTVIAENELLGAASSIDLAAKKLANLQPRIDSIKLPDEDLNFDEIILEAAKSIAQATAMLIRAASNAQKELVATGKVDAHGGGVHQFSDDDQWSEGLISASRHVAAATHSLVEAANALVLGQASEEKLISAAKQVASSTAQLLVACKVKADPESQAMKRLQTAGNAVKKATDNLVRAAQQAIEQEEEQNLIISKRRVQGITQEIVAREEILKKERELVEAREKLAAINRAKYGNRPPDEKDFGFTSVQQFNNTYYQQQDQQQQQTFNHNHPHHFHQEN